MLSITKALQTLEMLGIVKLVGYDDGYPAMGWIEND
jgi:hypothetical protein